jgi:aldose sugar dehydrogenase
LRAAVAALVRIAVAGHVHKATVRDCDSMFSKRFARHGLTIALVVFSIAARAADSSAEGSAAAFSVRVIATGMTYPWSLALLPNGEILVVEKPGRLRVVRNGRLVERAVSGTPVVTNLLEIAVDPNFATTHWLYLSYTRTEVINGVARSGLEVMRARFREDRLGEATVIFEAKPKLPEMLHFGGRMLFVSEHALLVSVGDGTQSGEQAQDLRSFLGKVVRIESPQTNPVAVVHTLGHRNVQGLAARPNGEVWMHEHGPIGGDELNVLVTGANYGWPIETSGERMAPVLAAMSNVQTVDPILTWTSTIAPSGLAIYHGDKFPQWEGDLFIGSLTQKALVRVRIRGREVIEQQHLLNHLGVGFRDVRVHQGNLYVLTHSLKGQLLQLVPRKI